MAASPPTIEAGTERAIEVADLGVRYSLRYRGKTGSDRRVTIEINPWGGYRFEDNGNEILQGEVLRAAAVSRRDGSRRRPTGSVTRTSSSRPTWSCRTSAARCGTR